MMAQILIALAIATVSALGGFGAGWKTQGWLKQSEETERVQNELERTQRARINDASRANRITAAQNAATAGARAARVDAAIAVSELDRLRIESAALVSRSSASLEACVAGANTLSDVLSQCSQRYTDVAGSADRHAIDAKTLSTAWPE